MQHQHHLRVHGSPSTHHRSPLARPNPAAGFSLSFTFGAPWPALLSFGLLFLGTVASLYLLKSQHTPERFQVPLFPLTPCLGILFTIHLICSLGWPAYVRFGVWMVLGLGIYALYGVHGAEQREREHARRVWLGPGSCGAYGAAMS